jgi:hypothetical protein
MRAETLRVREADSCRSNDGQEDAKLRSSSLRLSLDPRTRLRPSQASIGPRAVMPEFNESCGPLTLEEGLVRPPPDRERHRPRLLISPSSSCEHPREGGRRAPARNVNRAGHQRDAHGGQLGAHESVPDPLGIGGMLLLVACDRGSQRAHRSPVFLEQSLPLGLAMPSP